MDHSNSGLVARSGSLHVNVARTSGVRCVTQTKLATTCKVRVCKDWRMSFAKNLPWQSRFLQSLAAVFGLVVHLQIANTSADPLLVEIMMPMAVGNCNVLPNSPSRYLSAWICFMDSTMMLRPGAVLAQLSLRGKVIAGQEELAVDLQWTWSSML